MIDAVKRMAIRGTYINIIKAVYDKTRLLILNTPIQHSTESLKAMSQKKRNESHPNWKGGDKLSVC